MWDRKIKRKQLGFFPDNVYICPGNHDTGGCVGKKKNDYIKIKFVLNSQTLACNPQILMKNIHLEVWRQIGNKILVKTLQKFWSTHTQSNLIILCLEAILFTDAQKSSKSWQTPEQYTGTLPRNTEHPRPPGETEVRFYRTTCWWSREQKLWYLDNGYI